LSLRVVVKAGVDFFARKTGVLRSAEAAGRKFPRLHVTAGAMLLGMRGFLLGDESLEHLVDLVVAGDVPFFRLPMAHAPKVTLGAVGDFVDEDAAELGVVEGRGEGLVVADALAVGAEGGDGVIRDHAEAHEKRTEEGCGEDDAHAGLGDAVGLGRHAN